MTDPEYLSTAQAAPRLGVDASTVGKYIRHGLTIGRGRLRLKASRIYRRRGTTRLVWGIRPADVRRFNAQRGAR